MHGFAASILIVTQLACPIGLLSADAEGIQRDTSDLSGRKTVTPDSLAVGVIKETLIKLQKGLGRRGYGYASQNEEITSSKLRALGFESRVQLADIAIGQKFPLFIIELKQLEKYGPDDDPTSLFGITEAAIFPLHVSKETQDGPLPPESQDKDIRSSATVVFSKDGTPHVVEVGDPKLIRLLVEARSLLRTEGHPASGNYFAVSVPALALHLFGYLDLKTKELKLVKLNDVPGHVRKEDFHDAKEVLGSLKDRAQEVLTYKKVRPDLKKQLKELR